MIAQALAWAKPRMGSEPLLIAASESPTAVANINTHTVESMSVT